MKNRLEWPQKNIILKKTVSKRYEREMGWFVFFAWWYIKLHGLFNAKSIHVEEQLWYYSIGIQRGKMGVNTLPKVVSLYIVRHLTSFQLSLIINTLLLHPMVPGSFPGPQSTHLSQGLSDWLYAGHPHKEFHVWPQNTFTERYSRRLYI